MAVMSDSNLAYTEDVETGLRNDGFVQFQKDGVNTMILIDQSRYEKAKCRMDDALVKMVMAGIRDMEEGNLIPAVQVFDEIDKKYGL